jgi:hypothetical protein
MYGHLLLHCRASLVKIYEAAYDACAPQARRRSLQQAGFFSRMTDDQFTARQALFNATAAVSGVGVGCSWRACLLVCEACC